MKLYVRCHNRRGHGPEWWYALGTSKSWRWSEHAEDAEARRQAFTPQSLLDAEDYLRSIMNRPDPPELPS